ncbi:hypothetical protein JTB14_014002 [Gonioctena quinquepunctata]|nr:hypothetical protein JTB14_014002 [Gonioctena quinquepunctata]
MQKPMKNIEVPENTTNRHILYKRLSKDNGHKKSEEQPKAEENNTKKDEEKIILNTSFTEMLETLYKDFPKTTRKKKAIKNKALIVKKEVFPTKTTKSSKAIEAIAKTKDQAERTKHTAKLAKRREERYAVVLSLFGLS